MYRIKSIDKTGKAKVDFGGRLQSPVAPSLEWNKTERVSEREREGESLKNI